MTRQFYRKNELLCCSHIPGPSHNWLGLRLENDPVADVVVTRLTNRPHSTDLDEDKIVSAVKRGTESENAKSGSNWKIAEIAYVTEDSPRYSVYEMLARTIVSAKNDGTILEQSDHQLTKDLYDCNDQSRGRIA
jgi:hypothetical protein